MEAATTPPSQPPAVTEPEERWPALRTIATILKVVAWIIAIVGGLAVIIAAIAAGVSDDGGAGAAILTLILGGITVALYALFTFASAELLRLFVAVEENTRIAAGRR